MSRTSESIASDLWKLPRLVLILRLSKEVRNDSLPVPYRPVLILSSFGEIEEVVDETQADGTIVRTRKVRRPIMKKTFALKRIGYKVIPYEDDTDSRYSFIAENIVFVNKANPTYRAESARGDEFLLRHVISMVAEAVAQSKHPEGKEALELQNRLVAEAIRIHHGAVPKR